MGSYLNVNEHNGRTDQNGSVLNITYKDRKTNIWVRERAKVIDISSDVRKNEMVVGRVYQPPQRRPMDLSCHYLETMTRKGDKGDHPSGGETIDLVKYWSDTIWQRTAQDRLTWRASPKHGTLRLPDDDDDEHNVVQLRLGLQRHELCINNENASGSQVFLLCM